MFHKIPLNCSWPSTVFHVFKLWLHLKIQINLFLPIIASESLDNREILKKIGTTPLGSCIFNYTITVK